MPTPLRPLTAGAAPAPARKPTPNGDDGVSAIDGGGGSGGGGAAGGDGGNNAVTSPTVGCGGAGGTSLAPTGGNVTDGLNTGDGQITIRYTATVSTSTGLVVTPPSPAAADMAETLTATISPADAVGTVQFLDG